MPLPSVPGNLVMDLNPVAYDAATRVDGTVLTAANSGLVIVAGTPHWKAAIFANGGPSVRLAQGTDGIRVPCPVTDDFTIYGIFKNLLGAGGGGNWYANAPIMDGELGGITNDWGVNITAAQKLIAGTGNPDTTVVGTTTVTAGEHTICIRRVKSTGVFEVFLDDVLEITVAGNTNSMVANAGIYFGVSNSAQRAGGDVGRILAYDAAHSNADKSTMSAYILANAPEPPPLRSSKVMAYAVYGVPNDVIQSTKTVSYAIAGPGGDLTATKVVAYAVIEEIETLPSQVY